MRKAVESFVRKSIDGVNLTVVEVAIVLPVVEDAKLSYRAWLDLERGAIPFKLVQNRSMASYHGDMFEFMGIHFDSTVKITDIREMPNGGFYPSKSVLEHWERDPDLPDMTAEDLDLVRRRERDYSLVVFERETIDCRLVDNQIEFADDFFELNFPDHARVYVHGENRVVDGLELAPPLKTGEAARELTNIEWIDGQRRELEDFRGQVLVINFTDFAGDKKSEVFKSMEALQQQFAGEDVVILNVHLPSSNPQQLRDDLQRVYDAAEIKPVIGIADGKKIEESHAVARYGIHLPNQPIVIGKSGLVQFNPICPPGFEIFSELDCDELTEEQIKMAETFTENFYQEAGVSISALKEQSTEAVRRVEHQVLMHHIAKHIKAALAEPVVSAVKLD